MPKPSCASTVTSNGVPATAAACAVTTSTVAAPGFTVIVALVPVMSCVLVSVEVIVWFPEVPSTGPATNARTPWSAAAKIVSAGSVAWPSVLVKCTVPV